MRSRCQTFVVAFALLALPAVALAEQEPHVPAAESGEDLQTFVAGASRLEGRILAPCCWNQTIDIHGSEPSYQLRREIRRRLKSGESAEDIEASFVKRYGAKILAVPTASPLGGVATGLAVLFGGVGVAGYFMLRRWSRAAEAAKLAARDKGPEKRDALDERLDRELAEISE